MLREALALEGPVAIRYPKGAARFVPPTDVGAGLNARLVREGRDVCILAVGKLVEPAEEAASLLAQDGLNPTVWDVRVVKPLDPAMLASALSHRLVVTAEDGVRRGGAGTAIAAALTMEAREWGSAPPSVLTLGLPDAYIPQGRVDSILSAFGLDAHGLAASVLAALGAREVVGRH